MTTELPRHLSRRAFLHAGAGAVGLMAATRVPVWAAQPGPAVTSRPTITHGLQSGDVTGKTGIVWARADRPARMFVEVGATESFARARRLRGPVASAETDFTAQLELHGLPDGEDVFYRVWFEDRERDGLLSEPATGRFRTAPQKKDRRGVSFVWSGDTAGQGWGINPDFGGMRIYETMRQAQPDFFIHCGDTIYADGPLVESVPLPDGSTWRNIVIPEKLKVAETLDEFRGQYKYNLLDENVVRFNAEVPILAQWDDHETTNNWYPGEILNDPRYVVSDVNLLASRARRAFQEFMPLRVERDRHSDFYQEAAPAERIYRKVSYGPLLDVFFLDMRSYRGPNTANTQPAPSEETAILGRRQLDWLQGELRQSKATWKAIASDMPLGLIVRDGAAFEAVANDDDGVALGRELEIAELLTFIQRRAIRNVVWFTADVHYTAAHRYDPSLAAFGEFDPFWEFVSGPLNAGTFGPNELDATFGPVVEYVKAPTSPNQPPSAGLQFFGQASIDGQTEVLTVQLKDIQGTTLYSVDLQPI